MEFASFKRFAQQVYDEIPPEYREGVDGLLVLSSTVPHPSLPDVYTLGECRSEFYPSDFGGAGEVRSLVVLYHGSFERLAELDDDFDWHGEVWETITHEVRHHLESLASDDALEEMDYAEDQNFARREGEEFDPFFYRAGDAIAPGVYEVDRDVFIEREMDDAEFAATPRLEVEWAGRTLRLPRPPELGDVHFVSVVGAGPEDAELVLVLLRQRGAWEALRSLFAAREPRVLTSEAEVQE